MSRLVGDQASARFGIGTHDLWFRKFFLSCFTASRMGVRFVAYGRLRTAENVPTQRAANSGVDCPSPEPPGATWHMKVRTTS